MRLLQLDSYLALYSGRMSKMDLVPDRLPQPITFQQFQHTFPTQGFEFTAEDMWLSDEEARDCLLMIITTIGLDRFANVLPKESRKILQELLLSNL